MMTKGKKEKGKILPFTQDGDFYFRRGLSKLDQNNLLDAMAYYRKALSLEPENPEVRLAMAETLTEMFRFEESNRLLFSFFGEKEEDIPSECYYGMGINYIGLRDYGRARDSLEKYADIDPDGDFIYDAYDMLDALEEHAEEITAMDEEDTSHASRALLIREDFDTAIEQLTEHVEENPEDLDAHNSLALAHYCKRDFTKAVELAQHVLSRDRDNIQAHCSLAIFSRGMKDEAGERREGDYLAKVQVEAEEDMNRAAVTLMELGRYGEALPFMRRLFNINPYDTGTTHRLAVCCYMVGEYKQAMYCYDRLLKFDSHDSVALYYRNLCRIAAEGSPKEVHFNFHYEVPAEEVISRIRRMNKIIAMDRKEFVTPWQEEDTELLMLVYWGIAFSETAIKRAMLQFVAGFADEKAEGILRDFLLQDGQPEKLKREVFAMLKQNGAKEPYLAYIDGELVEGHVRIVEMPKQSLPRSYRHVIEYCLTLMHEERPEACLHGAVRLWAAYMRRFEVEGVEGQDEASYPRITRSQVFAMAAALEYVACQRAEVQVTKTEICRKYGVSLIRFNNAFARIASVKTEE